VRSRVRVSMGIDRHGPTLQALAGGLAYQQRRHVLNAHPIWEDADLAHIFENNKCVCVCVCVRHGPMQAARVKAPPPHHHPSPRGSASLRTSTYLL
jgi:hypothetical protein